MRFPLLLLASCWLLAACAAPIVKKGPPPPPVTASAELCADPSLEPDDFCMPVEWMEATIGRGLGEVLYVKVTESGVSRPNVVWLSYPGAKPEERIVIKAKWKIAPPGGDGFNNSPYKELAAYHLQKLFLEPPEYVVPPTIAVCAPVDQHEETIGPADPTFPDTDCVFGLLVYWIENVTDDDARDMGRFERDPAYRVGLAKLNLLTYLIDHRDPRDANFLVSKDPDRPRVFAIDNGLAFGGFRNPFTIFIGDWGDIRVPALPREHVERLRRVTRADLDALAVVAQFEIREGMLVATPPGPPLDPNSPVRHAGGIVQLGLTREQIDAVEARIRALLERVDAGKIELF